MFIDCGRIDVKEHAVTMLCEISHSAPNLITFDIYDMLRSYKIHASDMSLSHAIEIALHEIKQHCIHLHTQIDEYEKSLLPTFYNNDDNMESDICANNHFSKFTSEQSEVVELCINVPSQSLHSVMHSNNDSDTSEDDCQQYINNFLEHDSVNNLISEHNRLYNITSTENNLVSDESDLVHDFNTYVNNYYASTDTLMSVENNHVPAVSNNNIHSDVESSSNENYYSESKLIENK
jgi:uncharacterized glyoxalase superfamily metalloenzyme YdcJ